MLPFKSLIAIDKRSATPVYQQIANKLVSLIRDGVLKPGSDLPSGREMAALLQVHRKTIVAAYEELFAQDWIETIPRKGVLVSEHLPDIKPRSFKAVAKTPGYSGSTGFTFVQTVGPSVEASAKAGSHRLIINDGFPDARIAPVDQLMKEYRRLFHRPAVQRRMMFGDIAGSMKLRTAITKFLAGTRGVRCDEKNVMMTRGAQMAIYLAARIIIKPGDSVIVGDPDYFMGNMIFEQCGAKLLRVPVDENGIDVDAVEKLCKKKKASLPAGRPAMLYIIPHHHHPTTVTLSVDRRMKLLQIIREYKLPVIEDDYDYDFHYSSSPILPLASADHDGYVIYIGSLTKTLASSIKTGYMVAPENFINEARKLRRLIDIRGDDLFEEALASLFDNGTMQRHLKKSVKLYHQRRDKLCTLLENELKGIVYFSKPAGGMAVWTRFNKRYSLPVISNRASAQGLFMNDGSFYNRGGMIDYNAIRFGFASLNDKEMEETVSIIRNSCKGF